MIGARSGERGAGTLHGQPGGSRPTAKQLGSSGGTNSRKSSTGFYLFKETCASCRHRRATPPAIIPCWETDSQGRCRRRAQSEILLRWAVGRGRSGQQSILTENYAARIKREKELAEKGPSGRPGSAICDAMPNSSASRSDGRSKV